MIVGSAALHVGSIWNATEAAEALLELGADINAQNDLIGATPLHMAAMRGRREMCTLLLARGADPTVAEDSGRIAAEMADDASLTKFLLAAAERWVSGSGPAALAPEPEALISDDDEPIEEDSDDDDDDDTSEEEEDEDEGVSVHDARLAEQLKEEGNNAFRAGSHAEAARLYGEALALDTGNYLAYANRSNCWGKLGNWDDAASDARR